MRISTILSLPIFLAYLLISGNALAQATAGSTEESAAPVGSDLQRIQERRRVLFVQMLEQPNNLDIAFEYASLSARAGDIEASIATLERMLIFAPDLSRLQLELGVLYFRLGADETARFYFQAALGAPDVPQAVRARVAPYLKAIDRRTSDFQFGGTISAGVRYQSNANAGPSGGTITIPGLPPLELDDTATGQPDYNGFLTSNMVYSHDLKNQGDRFNVGLTTYDSRYFDRTELDTDFAELRIGPVFDFARFEMENTYLNVHAILAGVLLGEDPYLWTGGAGSSFSTLLTSRTQFASQAAYRHDEYINSSLRPTAEDRSGHRISGSLRVQHQLFDRFGIFASIDAERRLTEMDFLDVWEWGGIAGWQLVIGPSSAERVDPILLAVSAGYRRREFDAPDPSINPDEAELDEEVFVTGTLTLPIQQGWALQGQGGYRQVLSNYELREFDNIHGSLGLLKRF